MGVKGFIKKFIMNFKLLITSILKSKANEIN
jgi:hypothetical protein